MALKQVAKDFQHFGHLFTQTHKIKCIQNDKVLKINVEQYNFKL